MKTENVDNITDIRKYLQELKKHSPYNLCEYSDNSIYRRINKILKDNDLSLEQLIDKTSGDKLFNEYIVQEITVNTTEFFRDPEVWRDLYNEHLPKLKKKKSINIWHAGCSSGQEVYSNLILLNELGLVEKTNIIATDLNEKMLKAAKEGIYKNKYNKQYIENFDKVFNNIKSEHKVTFKKYFDTEDERHKFKIKDFLRKIPVYKKHDLVNGEQINLKFDVIFCRNVLIYFNTSLQRKILQQFYNKLNNGGMLILGNHEGLNGFFKTKFIKNGPVFIKNNTFHFQYRKRY